MVLHRSRRKSPPPKEAGARAAAASPPRKGGRRQRAAAAPERSWGAVIGRFVARLVARVAGLALVGVFGFVAWCALDLPDISEMGGGDRAGSVSVFAADGTFTAAYGDVYGGGGYLRGKSPRGGRGGGAAGGRSGSLPRGVGT
ncbi:MAG: hypothetical protein OXC11_01460, partial [Rhodospirillales bacterium]|nr:hypothetical protein [Rhodospirillales bacterium]